MAKEKTYIFKEPHNTGGHSVIKITASQIVEHMRALQETTHPMYRGASDERLIEEFVVIHWAEEE